MSMELSIYQLEYLLESAAKLSTKITLIKLGHNKRFVNLTKAANKLYGRSRVRKWISSGTIIPIRDGSHSSNYRIDMVDLEVCDIVDQLSQIL